MQPDWDISHTAFPSDDIGISQFLDLEAVLASHSAGTKGKRNSIRRGKCTLGPLALHECPILQFSHLHHLEALQGNLAAQRLRRVVEGREPVAGEVVPRVLQRELAEGRPAGAAVEAVAEAGGQVVRAALFAASPAKVRR